MVGELLPPELIADANLDRFAYPQASQKFLQEYKITFAITPFPDKRNLTAYISMYHFDGLTG